MEIFRPDPYDQYTQFDKLPKLLKRIPFANKMYQCYEFSYRSLEFLKLQDKSKYNSRIPLPWVVESLALMCIVTVENPNCSVSPKLQEQFAKMYGAIWDESYLAMPKATGSLAKFFGPMYAQTQFCTQETRIINYYRYSYIFSYNNDKINVNDCFQKKFGAPYWSFLLFCELIMMYLLHVKSPNPTIIERLITNAFSSVAQQLSITRDEYYAELLRMTNNSNDFLQYIFCVRPSYKYAFVKDNGSIYFPLPHLIPMNGTSALLYRLTEGNDPIRTLIGKNVLEDYLLTIVKESNVYDNVRGEIEYKVNRNGSGLLGPDVMAVLAGELLLLDSKSSVPLKDLRLLDEVAYEKLIDRYANNIVKLYKHVLNIPEHLNPFPDAEITSNDQIWGAVVVLEDAHVLSNEVYNRVNKLLSIEDGSQEATWISEHIKTVGLYDIEIYCFGSLNIIDGIKSSFSMRPSSGLKSPSLLSFREKLYSDLSVIAKEVFEVGEEFEKNN